MKEKIMKSPIYALATVIGIGLIALATGINKGNKYAKSIENSKSKLIELGVSPNLINKTEKTIGKVCFYERVLGPSLADPNKAVAWNHVVDTIKTRPRVPILKPLNSNVLNVLPK